MNQEIILKVEELITHFITDNGTAKAVNGVDFQIKKGETLGLVGESGCGKSVTALSILRLLPIPPAKIINGKIHFEGRNLLELDNKEMRKIRGNKISMIFQEPMTSLNPVFTIGNQIAEVIILHQKLKKKEAYQKTIDMLRMVSIPSPEKRINEYPHQLSGGMRQRIMIAMALSCSPQLLIADEPTTALDVTIQAQILELINKLKNDLGMTVLLITHDLGVVAEVCQNIAIMYAGKIVEYSDVYTIFEKPLHPYTKGLLSSAKKDANNGKIKGRLSTIPGNVPNPFDLPNGCKFAPRCTISKPFHFENEPPLKEITHGHFVACFNANIK